MALLDKKKGKRDGEEFSCRCGRTIGHFMSHHKYPELYSLDMGNGNIAETHHGRCGVCGAGVHFDFHWELAARLFKTDIEMIASWQEEIPQEVKEQV